MITRMVGTACGVALVVAACSDDNGDSAANSEPGGGAEPVAYEGYESDVYAQAENWLCRPELSDDHCDGDLDTTVVNADGTLEIEPFEPAEDAPIDCFYVYPTVSLDPGANSDLEPDVNQEGLAARNQVGRLASVCDVYAPVYEQVTLTSLTGDTEGGFESEAATTAYESMLDAWKHYVANDNEGRGVVLVGHSQGAGLLNQLVRREIDDEPALRDRLVSALLAGATVSVPTGEDVGGDFENVPACRAPDQTGCVLSWATFRASAPPSPGSTFASTSEPGTQALCTNPGALDGGPAPVQPYFETEQSGAGALGVFGLSSPATEWVTTGEEITTPWVTLPDLVEAECVATDDVSYLAVTTHGDAGPRVDDIGGDLPMPFGLHLVDLNVAMAEVVDLVGQQSDAYTSR